MKLSMTEAIADNRLRLHVAIVLWAALVWQLYTVVVAFRNASVLGKLLPSLGAEYPMLTATYLGVYRYFVAVPIVTALLSIHLLANRRFSLLHSSVVVVLALLASMVLQAWSTEAFFHPLLPLLGSAG